MLSEVHKRHDRTIATPQHNTDCNVCMTLNDNVLSVVDEVKDLGVIVDSHLSFHTHISNLIRKCLSSWDTATLWRAFIVYVRPLLKYAICVWSPYRVGQINHVESAQRKFTKRLPGYYSLEYKSRLMHLHADSPELRRLIYDLIYT